MIGWRAGSAGWTPRRRFAAFLDGMLSELPRKNCWTIAEHAGETSPGGMQHLLNRARWDTDGVAADLREFVVTHLGEQDAVLVVDLCRHRDYAEELAAARARCPCGVCVERVSEGLISA